MPKKEKVLPQTADKWLDLIRKSGGKVCEDPYTLTKCDKILERLLRKLK